MTGRFGRVTLFSTALFIYIIDRLAKQIILSALSAGQSLEVVPRIFHITLVFNKGAAFGIFKDQAAFFILISAFIITLIILFAWRSGGMSVPLAVSLGLVLGGSMGNLVDRITFGHVIDFFDFRIWPVFNIADSAISIGAAVLAIMIFVKK